MKILIAILRPTDFAFRASTIHAEMNNNSNHNKTHELLEDVLKNPHTDTSFRTMITEIHTALTAPALQMRRLGSFPRSEYGAISSPQVFPTTMQEGTKPHIIMNAFEDISLGSVELDARPTYLAFPAGGTLRQGPGTYAYFADSVPKASNFTRQIELPSAIIALNNKRRAFGAKEYEAFRKRHQHHQKSLKPAFLTTSVPNLQQLRFGIPHILQSVPNGRLEVADRGAEVRRWTEQFAALVANQPTNNSLEFVDLLVSLNQAVEQSDRKARQLFYQTSDLAGLIGSLDQLQSVSKSVRVMKEIEEFQDAREEWEEGR